MKDRMLIKGAHIIYAQYARAYHFYRNLYSYPLKHSTVFMLIKRKPKNNFKSGMRTIRVMKIPGSEFSSVNWMLRSNRARSVLLHNDHEA